MDTYKSRSVIGLLILAALLVSACGGRTIVQADATLAPPTATQTAVPPTATHTAIPPTSTPVPPTATPEPTSTPDVTATAMAQATQTAAPLIAMIDAELKKYDLSTDEGYLGWWDDSTVIKVDGYMEEKPQAIFPDVSAADFVLHADVTWETSTGLAGCAFYVRSEADLKRGKHYRIYMMRLGGVPLWDIEYYKNGQPQKVVTGEPLTDKALDSDQGSTKALSDHGHRPGQQIAGLRQWRPAGRVHR